MVIFHQKYLTYDTCCTSDTILFYYYPLVRNTKDLYVPFDHLQIKCNYSDLKPSFILNKLTTDMLALFISSIKCIIKLKFNLARFFKLNIHPL